MEANPAQDVMQRSNSERFAAQKTGNERATHRVAESLRRHDQTANVFAQKTGNERATRRVAPTSRYVLCEIGDDRSCKWSRQDRPDYNKLESKPPSTR